MRDGAVDRVLRWVPSAFDGAFPGRLRACYATGSHVDGTETRTSDLDLTIIFKDDFRDGDERRRAVELFVAAPDEVELDVDVVAEAELAGGVEPSLKRASVLIHGVDIREALPLLPIDEWARRCMHKAYFRTKVAFNRPTPTTLPLTYPDPRGEYYGYDRREEPARVFDQSKVRISRGSDEPATRILVATTLWAATALLAHSAGVYVERKADCAPLYQQHIGGEWAELLSELYDTVKGAWHCAIPAEVEARQRLRALCEQTLGFENWFLTNYRTFLVREMNEGDERRVLIALWMLQRIPFQDQEILCALRALTAHEGSHLIQAAASALAISENAR